MLLRVATFSLSDQMITGSLRTEAIMATDQAQEASGVKSTDFAGYGGDTQSVLNLQVSATRAQSYIDAASLADTKVQTMWSTVGQMADMISKMRAQLSSASVTDTTTTAAVISSAQDMLQHMGSLLNTQFNGQYVFAGGRTSTPAVDLSTFAVGAGSLTTPDTSYYKGDSEISSVQVAGDQTVNYGVTADNSAFEQIMRVLKFVANSATLTPTNISQAMDAASTALDATSIVQARLSDSASQIETASSSQTDYKNYVATLSSNLTGVDVAQITAQLSTYQAQLQASYAAIAKIQSLNLASFLK